MATAVTPELTKTAEGGDVRPNQDGVGGGGGSQQKRILRKVAAARIDYNQEHKIIAETRFAESEFVKECLDWHNHYRAHHLAPPLEFDPIVRKDSTSYYTVHISLLSISNQGGIMPAIVELCVASYTHLAPSCDKYLLVFLLTLALASELDKKKD